MKKFFNLALFTMILSLILPVGVTNVLADGQTYDANIIQNGDYDVTAKAMHKTEDKASGAAGFISEEATLSIKDGQAKLSITVPNNKMATIKEIQVEGKKAQVKESDNAKIMTFDLSKLKPELNSKVHYVVPSMDMDHDVAFRFILEGLDELPEKEAEKPDNDNSGDKPSSEDSEENADSDKDPKPEEKPEMDKPESDDSADSEEETTTDESVISLGKGHYDINTSYLKDDKDEASSMGSYIEKNAFLSVKDGKVFVTLTINDDETVTKLQVNGKNATEKKVDGNKRYETFALDSLKSEVTAYAAYQAPYKGGVYEGEADFRIMFDGDSVSKAKASDKPGYEVSDETGENNKDDESEKPSNNTDKNEKPNKGDKNKDEKDNKQEEKSLVPDKAYEVDYMMKHATKDEASAADSFFKKPGYLLEKDGVNYVQLTVTNSDMIDNLKTADGDVIIVKKNKDGSMVVQFKVGNDLSKAVLLNMHITVPGMYSMEHDARLFLDESSLKEINADKHILVAADNGNGPNVEGAPKGETLGGEPGNKDNKDKDNGNGGSNNTAKRVHSDTPSKPDLSSDKDDATTKSDKTQNPQTGDTSSILLYSLLLIGSLIPLARKFKRRFI